MYKWRLEVSQAVLHSWNSPLGIGGGNLFSPVRLMTIDATKRDLHKKVERLTREIVQCQNSMEAGRPCSGFPESHVDWLSRLQTDLAEAHAELSKLG